MKLSGRGAFHRSFNLGCALFVAVGAIVCVALGIAHVRFWVAYAVGVCVAAIAALVYACVEDRLAARRKRERRDAAKRCRKQRRRK